MGHHRRRTPLRRTVLAAGVAAGLAACSAGFAAAASLPVASQRFLAVSRAESVPPTTCTLRPVADTYTNGAAATTNYGAAADIRVASLLLGAKRTFVRFDLAGCSVPTTASVRSATLRLTMTLPPTQSRAYSLTRLTSGWTETGLTWGSSQPTTAGSATATVTTGTVGTTLQVDVTSDVQGFATTPSSNFGWTLRDLDETSNSLQEAVMNSREHASAEQRPTLAITFYP